MVNKNNKLIKSKLRADKSTVTITSILSWVFACVFLLLIGFIVAESINGFKTYGWSIFGSSYDLNANKASVWLPLCTTLIVSGLAILIASPIGIHTAVFIKYRLPQKYQKSVRILVELLADIPSVIFGLFASASLGVLIKKIFGLDTAYNLITAGAMLTFMILPTIVSLTLNSLDGVDPTLLNSSIALGNTKTQSIYKVNIKAARNGIAVSIIIALARAIGETMAISMILQSGGYNNIFHDGFLSVMTSGLQTLGALIAANMFADSGGAALKSLLFAFGIIMFVFVMALNAIAMVATKKRKQSKFAWWNKFERFLGQVILFIPLKIKLLWEKITYHPKNKVHKDAKYYARRTQNNKFLYTYTIWKIFWEIFCAAITAIFLAWILVDILGYGAVAISGQYSTAFSFVKDTTGQAFINTLLIITIAIGVGFPLSLFIAIYLNEYAKKGKGKSVLLFFIDSLGATPSILFGMFGLIFFIQTLGMAHGGAAGKSLLAGALTILIVILPIFIRTIQQALEAVPEDLRINSYALGAGKWETIVKIVLPAARQGIASAVVLSIGRILAETAPLYLTSGLSSSSSINLMNSGQTLTTRIYAQIFWPNIDQSTSIMYECAFVTMILVLLIICIVHFIIPWWFNRKNKKDKKIHDQDKKLLMKTKQEPINTRDKPLKTYNTYKHYQPNYQWQRR